MTLGPIVLNGPERISVGRKVIDASREIALRLQLEANPKAYFGFGDGIGHTEQDIIPLFNTANRTYIVVPYKEYLMNEPGTPGGQFYPGPPREYQPGEADYIPTTPNDNTAYRFRVGDYVFAGCG